MDLTGKRVLVTGGAGFVGSHLAERLLADDNEVVVADDLSGGRREWVPDGAEFVQADLTHPALTAEAVTEDVDLVFHAAARSNADDDDPRGQYEANVEMTYNLLQRMAEVGVRRLAFTSSSVVYGEAPRPTPEDYAPLEPISGYGASKLSCESVLSMYAHSQDFTVWNFRFANVVGPRLRNAVVPDFVEKLAENPETLTILGDGYQEKSYVHVTETVDAICHVVEHADRPMNTYNLGTRTYTPVHRIADVVSAEMGVEPEYEFTGGRKGHPGDVPRMGLSLEKLAALGWEPELSSDESIERSARELVEELT